jgi:hypothetical protein
MLFFAWNWCTFPSSTVTCPLRSNILTKWTLARASGAYAASGVNSLLILSSDARAAILIGSTLGNVCAPARAYVGASLPGYTSIGAALLSGAVPGSELGLRMNWRGRQVPHSARQLSPELGLVGDAPHRTARLGLGEGTRTDIASCRGGRTCDDEGAGSMVPMTPSEPAKLDWKARFSIISWWPVSLATPPARVETGQRRAGAGRAMPARIKLG